jgi:HK97 family phage major capsid protein
VTVKNNSRITELQTALQAKVAEINGLSSAWKVEDNGGIVVSTEQHKSYIKAVNDAEQIKGLLEAERKSAGFEEYLTAPQGVPTAGTDAVVAATAHRGERKTLGERYLASEAFGQIKSSGFRNFAPAFEISGLPVDALGERKDVFTAMGGTATVPGLGEAQHLPIIERAVRPTRVRDLFPKESTSAAILYGVRETGFTNNADAVAQRSGGNWVTAPKSSVQLETVTYPIAEVAHTLDVHKNTLSDEPRLRGLLDRDMVDGIKIKEDSEILYGDGLGESITGIFATPGVQNYTKAGSDKKSVVIRRAATRAMLAYYNPNGVVLHPFDWEDVEVEEDGQGQFRVAVAVAVGAETRLWKMDVVATPAINQNQALVGNFGLAAKLYDREEVSVTISTENGTNFEKGVVSIRAAERLALEIPRPEALVNVDLNG